MLDEEKLKIIQQAKNKAFSIYDDYRLDLPIKVGRHTQEIFDKLSEILQMLNTLTEECINNKPQFFQIIATEDINGYNECSLEVKTNITGLPINLEEVEIIFDRSIPSAGHLELYVESTIEGIKFFAKNKVSQKSKNTMTNYFPIEVYQIKKGEIIAVGIKKYVPQYEEQYSLKNTNHQ